MTISPLLDELFQAESLDWLSLRNYWPKAHRDGKERLITNGTLDYVAVKRFKEWLNQRTDPQKPFFSFFYLESSHFPYLLEEGLSPHLFLPDKLTEQELSQASFLNYPRHFAGTMKNRYLNALNFTDSLIGDILSDLREKGALKDTIVVVTGDHGELFYEHDLVNHAGPLFDETLRVPLIAWGVDGFRQINDGVVVAEHIDIAPTILKVLNLPLYENFQGKVLLVPDDESYSMHKTPLQVFSSVQSFAHQDAVVAWPWKFILDHRSQGEQLYQLAEDPKETRNRVRSNQKVALCMRALLSKFRNEQLTYYADTSPYKSEFFPPRHNRYHWHELLECQGVATSSDTS
jgi:arylsulfatase A-like enzyme